MSTYSLTLVSKIIEIPQLSAELTSNLTRALGSESAVTELLLATSSYPRPAVTTIDGEEWLVEPVLGDYYAVTDQGVPVICNVDGNNVVVRQGSSAGLPPTNPGWTSGVGPNGTVIWHAPPTINGVTVQVVGTPPDGGGSSVNLGVLGAPTNQNSGPGIGPGHRPITGPHPPYTGIFIGAPATEIGEFPVAAVQGGAARPVAAQGWPTGQRPPGGATSPVIQTTIPVAQPVVQQAPANLRPPVRPGGGFRPGGPGAASAAAQALAIVLGNQGPAFDPWEDLVADPTGLTPEQQLTLITQMGQQQNLINGASSTVIRDYHTRTIDFPADTEVFITADSGESVPFGSPPEPPSFTQGNHTRGRISYKTADQAAALLAPYLEGGEAAIIVRDATSTTGFADGVTEVLVSTDDVVTGMAIGDLLAEADNITKGTTLTDGFTHGSILISVGSEFPGTISSLEPGDPGNIIQNIAGEWYSRSVTSALWHGLPTGSVPALLLNDSDTAPYWTMANFGQVMNAFFPGAATGGRLACTASNTWGIVGPGSAVTNATGAGDIVTQFNTLLGELRTLKIIAT